jgi:hypothetical protein
MGKWRSGKAAMSPCNYGGGPLFLLLVVLLGRRALSIPGRAAKSLVCLDESAVQEMAF